MEPEPFSSDALTVLEGRAVRREPNGVLQLLNPLTQRPYQPSLPPEGLLGNATMRVGFNALQRLARENRLRIQLILAHHGGAADFTDILQKAARRSKAASSSP